MGNIDWKKQITIPNVISLVRLLAIPFLGYEIYRTRGYSFLSVLLFALIWLTDALDGYIARKYNQVSALGKVLDPLVDKLLHTVTAVMMTVVGRVPLWVAIALVIKEVIMVVGAAVLMKFKIIVSAKWYGKVATILVAVAFGLCLLLPPKFEHWSNYIFILPVAMLYFALFSYAYQIFYVAKNDLLKVIPENKDGFRDLSTLKINK